MRAQRPIDKSQTMDSWCTPRRIVTLLHRLGPVKLDPCSNPDSIVGAKVEWYGQQYDGPRRNRFAVNGLAMPWHNVVGRGEVAYSNPPYSAKPEWTRKISEEASLARYSHFVSLVPADTDTAWFQDYGIGTAKAILFLRGRLRFYGDRDSTARFPSAMFYWGPSEARFRRIFGEEGWMPWLM